MSFGPSLYYNKSGSYDFQKYIHLTKPLMEIRKNKQENYASDQVYTMMSMVVMTVQKISLQ